MEDRGGTARYLTVGGSSQGSDLGRARCLVVDSGVDR